jgi:hypothetical protein
MTVRCRLSVGGRTSNTAEVNVGMVHSVLGPTFIYAMTVSYQILSSSS